MRTSVDLSSFLQIRSKGNLVEINSFLAPGCLQVFPFTTCIAAGGPISPCLFPTVWRPEHALCWQRAGNSPAGSEEWINCNVTRLSALRVMNNFSQQWPPEWGLDRSTSGFQHWCPSSWNKQYSHRTWYMHQVQISDTSANDSLRVCQWCSCTDPNAHKHGWNS